MVMLTNVPSYESYTKCVNLTYMNCNERIILIKLLLSYDDDNYTSARPYDLKYDTNVK